MLIKNIYCQNSNCFNNMNEKHKSLIFIYLINYCKSLINKNLGCDFLINIKNLGN